MKLPFADNSVGAATMALVLFFVPEPAKGVAEMARVVKRRGMFGGGFPQEPIFEQLRAMGHTPADPPTPEASKIPVMQELCKDASMSGIETRVIGVERTFRDFDDFWSAMQGGPS